MLRRTVNGDLVWGPGHLATQSTATDTSLWAHMTYSYLRAGVILTDRLEQLESDRRTISMTEELDREQLARLDRQYLVLPIVTLLRQGTELLLKTLWLVLCDYNNEPHPSADEWLSAGHNLERLLTKAKPILDQFPPPEEVRVALERLVKLLIDVAPGADDPRYPARRDMKTLTRPMIGEFVDGVLAVPFVNVSELARLAQAVTILVFTVDAVAEALLSYP